MAKDTTGPGEPEHRGRIQAQGGETEKSVSWAQDTPPTESEMLRMADELEAQLTDREKKVREEPLADLRRFIRGAAKGGGISSPLPSRSFPKRGSKDIRIDLNLFKGMACVPDPQ